MHIKQSDIMENDKKKHRTHNMVRMSISLSKETEQKLRNIAKEEHRKYSDQIEHMIEFYLKYKDKVK